MSWEAEDAVIRAGREVFDGLPAEVEIRNEARVHLWYERKFGVPCPPYGSSEAAIDSFAATTWWAKAARWREQWPELTVLEWPMDRP
ncbi:nucleotidyltransferase family protein [Streptomyces sp. NPDC057403]|uniref:nucleotidyltransferase family protein n=1 Tax=Streptomyces sp. NPDC057403 TaxID=3346119 RepID=UPI00368282C8